MTPHMIALLREAIWNTHMTGPVIEIGSFRENHQDHFDLRRAFPPGTVYVGTDVIEGPGVDRIVDLLDAPKMEALFDEVQPKTILCLYVLEHAWDIRAAANALGALRRRSPESWLWVATHQNQPFHGTKDYGDYWRITASGMHRLFEEAGVGGPHVLVCPDTSNPSDIVMVRQPDSLLWPQEAIANTLHMCSKRAMIIEGERLVDAPHWEQFS